MREQTSTNRRREMQRRNMTAAREIIALGRDWMKTRAIFWTDLSEWYRWLNELFVFAVAQSSSLKVFLRRFSFDQTDFVVSLSNKQSTTLVIVSRGKNAQTTTQEKRLIARCWMNIGNVDENEREKHTFDRARKVFIYRSWWMKNYDSHFFLTKK